MEFNPQWITLVFSLSAMIASAAGLFVNMRIADTEFKVNVLSVNRQKWVETMRDLVASLNSQLLTTAAVRHTLQEPTGLVMARDPELFRRVEYLLRTVSKIELMLNPLEHEHQQLNSLMNEAIDKLRSGSSDSSIEDSVEAIGRKIIQVSQVILKREVGRVIRGE